jgi:hypothetical protein
MLKRNLLVAAAILALSGSAAFADSTSKHHHRSHHSLYEQRMSYAEPAYDARAAYNGERDRQPRNWAVGYSSTGHDTYGGPPSMTTPTSTTATATCPATTPWSRHFKPSARTGYPL